MRAVIIEAAEEGTGRAWEMEAKAMANLGIGTEKPIKISNL